MKYGGGAVASPIFWGGKGARILSHKQIPIIFIIPTVLFIAIFAVFPFLVGVGISFFRFRLTGSGDEVRFVGLANYWYIITKDLLFRRAFLNSFKWMLVVTIMPYIIGLFLAMKLNTKFRGRSVIRLLSWLPWAVPLMAVVAIWQLIYQPQFGLLNGLLTLVGLGRQRWLGSTSAALFAVSAVQVWRWTPFYTIVLLASLQAIPARLYEAAKIDGATPFQEFRYITFPLMRSTSLLTLLIGSLWALQAFDLIYAMTQGGPAGSSHVLPTLVYQYAFRYGYLDRGAAVGVFIALGLLVFGFVWVRSEMGELKYGK